MEKRRTGEAPLLVFLGGPLLGILDAGVRVLTQRDWEDRERLVHTTLGRGSVTIKSDRALVLPCVPGDPLSTLLEDKRLVQSASNKAIELAVLALADFHARGLTHADAMAENVLVDLDSGVAHWIDFETTHDPGRSLAWRRADDLRALLATCLLRVDAERIPQSLDFILDAYGDASLTPLVATTFNSLLRRSLLFHLGQAGLSFERSREIARLLADRLARGA